MRNKKVILSVGAIVLLAAVISAVWYAQGNWGQSGNRNPNISELGFDTFDLDQNPGVGMEMVYESDSFIIFYGDFGLFGYDLERREMTFGIDFIKVFGKKGSVQGEDITGVEASADGKTVVFLDTGLDNELKAYRLDIPTLTYTYGEWGTIENLFRREDAVGYIRAGGDMPSTLYIRNDKSWAVFEGYTPSAK